MHRNDVVSLYLSFIQNVARIEVWLLSNYTVEFAFGIFGGISRSLNSLDFRCQTVPCNVNLHVSCGPQFLFYLKMSIIFLNDKQSHTVFAL